jgi:hemerythrin
MLADVEKASLSMEELIVAFITWTYLFSVGVSDMDNEHKVMVALINELYDAMQQGRSEEVLKKIVDEVIKYTKIHFVHEELLLAETNYPGADAHKKEHDGFIKHILMFHAKCTDDPRGADAINLMNFLRNWLVNHILFSDHKYKAFLNAKGIQ